MTFKQVLKKYFFFIAKEKRSYGLAIFLVLLSAFLSKTIPYLYGKIVDALNELGFNAALTFLLYIIVIKILLIIFDNLRWYFALNVLIKGLWRGTRLKYIEALQNVDYEYHTNKSSGALVSLAKRGENALASSFIEVNINALLIFVEFIISIIILSTIHISFTIIFILTIVISMIVGYYLIKINVHKRKKSNEQDDHIVGLTVDNMIGFETLKIFAKERFEMKRFVQAYIPWTKAHQAYQSTFRYIDISMGVILLLSLSSIFYFGITSVEAGVITVGAFVAAMVYVFDISTQVHSLVFKVRELAKAYTDLTKYFEVIALRPNIKDPDKPIEFNINDGNIEFKNITFHYKNNRNAIKNVNLQITSRKKIALVGKSGSGKTTLTKLFMRFYDVSTGEIMINGTNIKNFSLQDLRQSIGLVPQEAVLFNDTIGYNLAYGKPKATQAEIETAAKKAQLHNFIMTLPKKYETIVGERGIKLSGGQKQRLAIARVILENPPIIIFDEATSQLDSENERKIQKAFDSLTKNKTTIIIAHRLSTVMNSDRIIVFQEGRIVQEGKHDDLIKINGVYKKLWKLQTEVYE